MRTDRSGEDLSPMESFPARGADETRESGFGAGLDRSAEQAAETPPAGSSDGGSSGTASGAPARRKRGGRRRSRRRGGGGGGAADGEGAADTAREPGASAATGDEGGNGSSSASGERRPRRRRRRKSGGNAAAKPADSSAAARDGDDGETDGAEDDAHGAVKKRRRRGSRGGRRRRKSESSPAEVDVIPGEDDDLSDMGSDDGDDGDSADDRGDAGTGRSRRRRSRGERDEAPAATASSTKRDQLILVNAAQPQEMRVAVVEGTRIVDFYMTVDRHNSYVNDIYRGRVVNLEPAIGAAFVDFGQGRNGFLHSSDVMGVYGDKDFRLEALLTARVEEDEAEDVGVELDVPDGDKRSKPNRPRDPAHRGRKRLPIETLLKKGSMAVVQITKDAIGDKGPTLTTYISIPGRYIVLMPSLARTGVSRKIEDDRERKRLKRILQTLDIPEGMGVIVRTAGTAKTKKDLQRDLDYLLAVWDDFSKRLVSGRNPMPLYQESDVAIRTMRDLFSERTEAVIVDDAEVYTRMVEFTERLMPEQVGRVRLHDGNRPLFHTHGVEQDFERIFAHRVDLPSGGSIVFDQTEALVAIDVNSGRTRGDGANFEDIALKTNLEAVPEIARQIRLRDLGGILVMDFIDMMRTSSRRHVERALRSELALDRARSKVGRISQFGLLELTRQRLGPGLQRLVFDPCPACRGSGHQRTATSKAQAILRRLGSALTQKGFTAVELRAHPETIDLLQTHFSSELAELEQVSGRELTYTKVPDQQEDSVLRYLRTDGREVRPGGRRKR